MPAVLLVDDRPHNLLALEAILEPLGHELVSAGSGEDALRLLLHRDDFERMRQGLLAVDNLPPSPSLTKEDWTGALGVFLLVFLSTFPIVIPFLIFRNVYVALRLSNLVALVMLFITGSWLARYGGHNPLWTGLAMMTLGVVLVGITIALGG